MIAVDTNVLVYAHRRESRFHEEAAHLMKGLAEGVDQWAIPWPCIYEFFSVVTHPRIWKEAASSPVEAWIQIRAWTGSKSLTLFSENEHSLDVLRRLLRQPRIRGPIVHDARIVAICLVHGIKLLWTKDRDFSLFPDLPAADPFPNAVHE